MSQELCEAQSCIFSKALQEGPVSLEDRYSVTIPHAEPIAECEEKPDSIAKSRFDLPVAPVDFQCKNARLRRTRDGRCYGGRDLEFQRLRTVSDHGSRRHA